MTRVIIIIATTIADVTTAPMITLELPGEHTYVINKRNSLYSKLWDYKCKIKIPHIAKWIFQ